MVNRALDVKYYWVVRTDVAYNAYNAYEVLKMFYIQGEVISDKFYHLKFI